MAISCHPVCKNNRKSIWRMKRQQGHQWADFCRCSINAADGSRERARRFLLNELRNCRSFSSWLSLQSEVLANAVFSPQMITVYSLPGMDPDWLIGERGNQKGKVPVTYLELLS